MSDINIISYLTKEIKKNEDFLYGEIKFEDETRFLVYVTTI